MQAKQEITQERLKYLLEYNPDTGVFTRKIGRKGVKKGAEAGCIVKGVIVGKSYRRISIDYKIYAAHRLAWLYMTGEMPPDQIDHIDGNGLNNKWKNLRSVSAHENKKNKRLPVNNSSGFCGVAWNKVCKKWRALIQVNGKSKHLGMFKDKSDAIKARVAANIKYGFHENHGQIRPL